MIKKYASPNEALEDLNKRGYEANFETESFCLYCGDLDMRLDPEEFKVDEEYRFEGEPGHDEAVVIVAITSSSGTKGILIDGHASYVERKKY